MGQTLTELSSKSGLGKPIFPHRFVVEICEKVHTHYRNLRLVNNMYDWVNMAEGFRDALDRWKKRGCPGTREGTHIELCRKKILSESDTDSILINLNKNLYEVNKGSIFAEGVELEGDRYIHLKIGDLRVELTIHQFKLLADAITEADKKLKDSDTCSVV